MMEMASRPMDRVLLLGPLEVFQNGEQLPQPPSRKVRALLAYLAMTSRPVSREKLCEVFWDTVDDPRSELRWCLSKLRPLVDGQSTKRLFADHRQARIDTDSLCVDAVVVARNVQKTLTSASPNELRSLLALFRGDFLEGLSSESAPLFENWLAGQRHHFGQLRQQLLERLSAVLPLESDDRIDVLRQCIEIAPFDEGVHIELVRALLLRGLHSEAEQQIDTVVRRFQAESIDPTSLRAGFAAARRSSSKPASLIDVPRLDPPSGQ
jgi:DNA-binding SARP family transcriptional activator